MAIAYGYKGEAPKHLDWFCTDEDQGTYLGTLITLSTMSPECSKSDATSDPYSFWEGRLSRAIDMVIGIKSTATSSKASGKSSAIQNWPPSSPPRRLRRQGHRRFQSF